MSIGVRYLYRADELEEALMAEDRTPRKTSLTDRATNDEAESQRQKRDHHRRHRDEPDRRERPNSPERRFPGRNEHEGPASKLL